ncbi:hypothetical protein lbkm_3460 [Lachnospiraceae bacterium KM106-2]|nr:hypothetical protein lbkm_3460 [Lachnospiraceae bacterium KM106-2]
MADINITLTAATGALSDTSTGLYTIQALADTTALKVPSGTKGIVELTIDLGTGTGLTKYAFLYDSAADISIPTTGTAVSLGYITSNEDSTPTVSGIIYGATTA